MRYVIQSALFFSVGTIIFAIGCILFVTFGVIQFILTGSNVGARLIELAHQLQGADNGTPAVDEGLFLWDSFIDIF